MLDIDAIVQQHNQYALNEMMSTLRTEVVQRPQPENWALSVLVSKLRTGPPLLSELLSSFTGVESMAGFLELIMRYLPDHEVDILKERGNARLYRFCQLFGRRYFPLPPYTYQQSIDEFIRGMPVQLLGMSYTAYHELTMRPGYILLLSLLIYPYEGDDRDGEDDRVPFDPFDPLKNFDLKAGTYKPAASDIKWLRDLVASLAIGGQWVAPIGFSVVKIANNSIQLIEAKNTAEVKELVERTIIVAGKAGIKAEFKRTGRTAEEKLNGARVALLDSARQMVGDNLAQLIPREGWERNYLHIMTDGTLYDGVGNFADWVFRDTGCVIMDSNYENCSYEEGETEPTFAWSKRNIDKLAKEWPRVKQIREKIDNVVEFIEGDPSARFGELLQMLISKNQVTVPIKKRESVAVSDMTESYMDGIELDQVLSEEEEDE